MSWRWVPGRKRAALEDQVARLRVELDDARRLARLSEHSPHAMIVHCDGVIRWANREAAEMAGLSDPAEGIGRSLYDFIDPASITATVDRVSRLLSDGGVLQSAECFLQTVHGERIVVETRAARTVWAGRPAVHTVVWDMTKRYEARTTLEWEASHDPLTGIWNRRAVLRHLQELLATGEPGEVAVALVDLNGFKAVNDSLGHQTGDRVLVHLADRLRELSGSDSVGRLGGDEFLVVCASAVTAQEVARRIEAELHLDHIEGVELPAALSATVGVASAERADATVERLLAQADADLYRQRGAGRRSPVADRPIPGQDSRSRTGSGA